MHDRVRREAGVLRAAVRRFLAHGRLARLAACLIVAFAAVVWIAIASIVLRVLFVAVLVVILTACVWLIAGVWIGEQVGSDDVLGSAWRVARRWARRVVPGPTWTTRGPRSCRTRSRATTRSSEDVSGSSPSEEEAFATVRASVDAAIADLHRRQERLHTDGAQLQEKLAEQIEAMRAVVARMAELGRDLRAGTALSSSQRASPQFLLSTSLLPPLGPRRTSTSMQPASSSKPISGSRSSRSTSRCCAS